MRIPRFTAALGLGIAITAAGVTPGVDGSCPAVVAMARAAAPASEPAAPAPHSTHSPLTVVATDLTGAQHAAAEKSAAATVWIFIAHDCPICNAFAPEIARISARSAPRGVALNLVYSEPGLSKQDIEAHAKAYHLNAPLFQDPDGKLAAAFGVATTPQAVLVDARSRQAYSGRIDDRFPTLGTQRAEPTSHDLEDAIDAVLAGRPVPHPETPAVGCAVEGAPR